MPRRSIAAGASLGALLTLLCAGAGIARAQQDVKVAVLSIEPDGAPAILAGKLATALKTRVHETPGFKLVPGKALDEIKLVFGCVNEKPACMARVGGTLSADKLLWGTLSAGSDGNYKIQIRFLDVRSARIVNTVNTTISAVEASSPDDAVARLTRSFLVASHGTIKLNCPVDGAQVLLGATVKGTCDGSPLLLRAVPAGTHMVQVRKDNYRTWVKRITVAAGATVSLDVKLEALGSPDKPPGVTPPDGDGAETSSRTGWKVAFWTGAAVTAGLGVGILVSGLSVLSLQDDKEQKIKDLLNGSVDPNTSQGRALQSGNACDVARGNGYAELDDVCSRGKTRATVVNALIGAAAVTSILSGYFLYRAYIKADDKKKRDDDKALLAPPRPRVRVQSGFGPEGVQLGVSVDF